LSADPLVTVCIPSYNYGRHLPEAVESVLAQTFRAFELLIVDDGSVDDSLQVARRYAAQDPRVRVLTHDENSNRGMGATLNAGFARARGTYLANFGADDALTPTSLERRLAVLQSDSELGFVYGRIEIMDPDGHPTGKMGGYSAAAMCGFDATSDPLEALLLHSYIPEHTVLMRRDAFDHVGGFDERFFYCDWELTIKLLAQTRVAFVGGEPLTMVRWHAHNLLESDSAHDLPRRLEVFRALETKTEATAIRLGEPRVRALIRLQRAAHAAQLGHMEEAEEAVSSAFRADPSLVNDPRHFFWWLTRMQTIRVSSRSAGESDGWWRLLARPRTRLAAVTTAGARAGHLPAWALEVAARELPDETLESLRWGVLGNELEAATSAFPSFRILLGCFVRAMAEPRLLADRWFAKTFLASAGLWRFLVRLR
jgi:glycosyltransferase involved in cell wall biosynthesis